MTKESSAHENFKKLVVNAKEGDTLLTLREIGAVRLLKNKFFDDIQKLYKNCASVEELKEFSGKSRAKKGMFEGNLEEGKLEIGQISSIINEIKSVKDVIDEIIEEFNTIKKMDFNF